jgi:hypothetical protein
LVVAWRDLLGFSEVVQAVDPARGVVLHEEHDTGSVFCPREQEQIIGAEIERATENESFTEELKSKQQTRGFFSRLPRYRKQNL